METILRIFQLFLAAALIGVVLLQRSEGGGLGLGTSGGAGSFMSVRGTANFLTRVTAILAALFMTTCLALAMLAKPSSAPRSIFDAPATPPTPAGAAQETPGPAPAAPAPAAEAPAPAASPAAPEPTPAPVPTAPQAPAPAPAAEQPTAPQSTTEPPATAKPIQAKPKKHQAAVPQPRAQ